MPCKLCKQDKKLVNAHILPESFYRSIKFSDKPLIIYPGKEGLYPKRSYTGIYDTGILCVACEKIFGPYDDYGDKVLLQENRIRETVEGTNHEVIGCLMHSVDYKKLKLFFMSVLWRCAISSKPEFEGINLPAILMNKLEHHIKAEDPGDFQDFAVLLSEQKFPNDEPVMGLPGRSRFLSGFNLCEIPMGRYIAIIKTDKRNIPRQHSDYILQPDKPLFIFYLPFRGSKIEKRIKKAIKINNKFETKR